MKRSERNSYINLVYQEGKFINHNISPATFTRLLYLSTYIDKDNRIDVPRDSIRLLLGLSDRTYHRFIKEVIDNNLLIDKDNEYYVNDSFVVKNVPVTANKLIDKKYMRAYNDIIRDLYKSHHVSEHVKIAYLYWMIPFVSIKYNVLCHNPQETNLNLIQPMKIKEYCSLIGYSCDNYRRFKAEMLKLTTRKSFVVSFIDNSYGSFCFINPKVFYGGHLNDTRYITVLTNFKK